MSVAIRRLYGADEIGRLNMTLGQKGEIPLDRHKIRQLKLRLGLRRLGLGQGNFVEFDFKADKNSVDVERLKHARMQLAEIADDIFRSELQCARSAGMKPGRSVHADLQTALRNTKRAEQSQSVGFGVENVGVRRAIGPMAPAPRNTRAAAPQTSGHCFLIFGRRAPEDGADFKQSDITEAPRGIALRRRDEARQKARPHIGEIRRDRIGEHERFRRRRTLALPHAR